MAEPKRRHHDALCLLQNALTLQKSFVAFRCKDALITKGCVSARNFVALNKNLWTVINQECVRKLGVPTVNRTHFCTENEDFHFIFEFWTDLWILFRGSEIRMCGNETRSWI